MAGSFPGIVLRGRTYYARVGVPAEVRHLLGRELSRSLKTTDFIDARKAAPPILADFHQRIATARRGTFHPDGTGPARIALANWAITEGRQPAAEPVKSWEIEARAESFRRAWNDPDGWKDIPDFDARLVAALARGGLRISVGDPVVAQFRQEAAVTMMYATLAGERDRLSRALRLRADALEESDLDDVLRSKGHDTELPPPSLTISQLFERWVPTVERAEKEKGRLRHQIRRLMEVLGDKPANYVTKTEIEEFMNLVARFPGRKRPDKLNALPMRELVDVFDSLRGTHAGWRTLTAATAGEWFAGFSRMFRYGVRMDLIPSNPFDGLRFLAKGSASIQRRGYTDAEIARVFGLPLF